MKKKIGNFILCWISWWLFGSAAVSLTRAAYTYATGVVLAGSSFQAGQALFVNTVCSLFLTIWWFLVIKRR